MSPLVRRARDDDREAIVDLTVEAFVTEGATEYIFAGDYRSLSPSFFGYLLDERLRSGEVWVAEHESVVASVAMWNVPEEMEPQEDPHGSSLEDVAKQYPPDVIERRDRYNAFLDGQRPTFPHYYLGVVATDPRYHSRGLGSAVLRPTLQAADAAGYAAYLETGTEANLAYYVRHHFEVDAMVHLPDGPRVWWMRRPAQTT